MATSVKIAEKGLMVHELEEEGVAGKDREQLVAGTGGFAGATCAWAMGCTTAFGTDNGLAVIDHCHEREVKDLGTKDLGAEEPKLV